MFITQLTAANIYHFLQVKIVLNSKFIRGYREYTIHLGPGIYVFFFVAPKFEIPFFFPQRKYTDTKLYPGAFGDFMMYRAPDSAPGTLVWSTFPECIGEVRLMKVPCFLQVSWWRNLPQAISLEDYTRSLKIWVVVSTIFLIFTPIWGRFPFWLIFIKWVETTNQEWSSY